MIGIFDSGFGGLTIMKGILKELPDFDYIYLGDTARVPYGNRSKEEIYEFTKQAVDFLFKNNCELVILACNSASADALRRIQQEYLPKYYSGKKVLGVLIPAAEHVVEKTKNKRVGVIATKATVRSKAFEREITKLDSEIKVFQNACPKLVPIVENGEHDKKEISIVLEKYLKPLIDKEIDALILGCTHYGVLESNIKSIIGRDIAVINESEIVAKKLRNYLSRHKEIEFELTKNSKRLFYSTDVSKGFRELGERFLEEEFEVNKAVLE